MAASRSPEISPQASALLLSPRRATLPALDDPDERAAGAVRGRFSSETDFAAVLRQRAPSVQDEWHDGPHFDDDDATVRFLVRVTAVGGAVSVVMLLLVLLVPGNPAPARVLQACSARGTPCPPHFPEQNAAACVGAFGVLLFIDFVALWSLRQAGKTAALPVAVLSLVIVSNSTSMVGNLLALSGHARMSFKAWLANERGFDSAIRYAGWVGAGPLTITSLGVLSRMPIPVIRSIGLLKGASLFLHALAVHSLSAHASMFWMAVALSTCVYFYSVALTLRELRRLRRHVWPKLAPLVSFLPLDAVWGVYLGACILISVGWATSTAGITTFGATHTIMTFGELGAKGMCTIACGLLQVGQRGLAVTLSARQRAIRASDAMASQSGFANYVLVQLGASLHQLGASAQELRVLAADEGAQGDHHPRGNGVAPATTQRLHELHGGILRSHELLTALQLYQRLLSNDVHIQADALPVPTMMEYLRDEFAAAAQGTRVMLTVEREEAGLGEAVEADIHFVRYSLRSLVVALVHGQQEGRVVARLRITSPPPMARRPRDANGAVSERGRDLRMTVQCSWADREEDDPGVSTPAGLPSGHDALDGSLPADGIVGLHRSIAVANARGVVQAMGGSIDETISRRSRAFVLRLPLVAQEAPGPTRPTVR